MTFPADIKRETVSSIFAAVIVLPSSRRTFAGFEPMAAAAGNSRSSAARETYATATKRTAESTVFMESCRTIDASHPALSLAPSEMFRQTQSPVKVHRTTRGAPRRP